MSYTTIHRAANDQARDYVSDSHHIESALF